MRSFLLIISFLLLNSINIFSQCSDAGVCSIGGHQADESSNASLSFEYIFGASGEEADKSGELNDLKLHSIKLQGIFPVSDLQFTFALPYNSIEGPSGSADGIGDLLVTASKNLIIDEDKKLIFTLGGKFKTGDANSNPLLPQRYQPGLGTNDLLLGVLFELNNFSIGAAYQKSFGRSENQLTRLERGDDLLLRSGYKTLIEELMISGEILLIKKLQNISIRDAASSTENFIEVNGSNETQVNLLLTATYPLSDNFSSRIQAAIPFLKRDYNYDGLKRTISLSAGIVYNFGL